MITTHLPTQMSVFPLGNIHLSRQGTKSKELHIYFLLTGRLKDVYVHEKSVDVRGKGSCDGIRDQVAGELAQIRIVPSATRTLNSHYNRVVTAGSRMSCTLVPMHWLGTSIPRLSADRKPKWLMKLSYHEQAFRARYQSPQRGACQRHKSFLFHSYVLGSFSLLVHRASGGALMKAYRQPDFELTKVQWRKTRPSVQQQGHEKSQLAVYVWWLRALRASPTQHW